MNSTPLAKSASHRPIEGPRWPAPWIFSVLVLPAGINLGFLATALPFLLAKAHVPVDRIASTESVLALPWILCFLWSPLIDVKFHRRTWLIIAACVTAVCLGLALPLAGKVSLLYVTALSLGGGIAASLVMATCGGLMVTTLSAPAQAKAAAWYEGGKLGGSALGAGLMLWLSQHTSITVAAAITAALIISPALMALTLPKSARQALSPKPGILLIVREVRSLWRSVPRRWSILLLASPVGAGAAMALLPAIAGSYNVNTNGVIWINGVGGGAVLVLGSLLGVLFPAEWDRKVSYVSAGFCNALATLILVFTSHTSGYFFGTILYLATTGCCWARYAAIVAETVGSVEIGAGTRYSVVTAIGNLPLAYMVWLDGAGFYRFGNRGLLWTDAAGNLLMFVIVAAGLLLSKRFTHEQSV